MFIQTTTTAYESLYAAYLTSVDVYEDNGYNELDAISVYNACHALAVNMAENGCPMLATTWQELAERYSY